MWIWMNKGFGIHGNVDIIRQDSKQKKVFGQKANYWMNYKFILMVIQG